MPWCWGTTEVRKTPKPQTKPQTHYILSFPTRQGWREPTRGKDEGSRMLKARKQWGS